MSILVVLHEATRTGAPKVGGLIAAALQEREDVRVLCLSDGPLVPWLRERVGAGNVAVIDYRNERHRVPFAERLAAAEKAIAEDPSDLVYVNSAAASEYVVAAKAAGLSAVLHVHEKADSLRRMFEIDLTKREILALCDAVVLAAGDLREDLEAVYGFVPERVFDFGIAIDAEEMARLADEDAPVANAAGGRIDWGRRLAIGMCGHASPRKGADIFLAAAAACPGHDFVWVGNWDERDAPDNPVLAEYAQQRLPNLYVTGGVDNPYKYIGRFDLFFLSSREDPNPLVLAEALVLGVPVLAFSETTAVTDFLGRSGILCHGAANAADAVRVLRALDAEEVRSKAFRGLTERFRARFDIAQKIGGLAEFLAAV
ncbi:MAG TPA: glycosyltransferase [Stellaceae bacterium]|nr:glycosyltransferase [Stellaceae bacterium]